MSKFSNFFLRISTKDQILLARNLSLMTRTGMPILESLHMIERQSHSSGMKKILSSVISDVENGQFLSTSLNRYQAAFGNLFINIIKVGEASGTLSENLGFLADELKKKQELRGKIVGALIYPAIIMLTTLGLIIVMTFVVFPKILPVFKSFKVKLPLSTRILISTNEFVLKHWLQIGLGLALFLGLVWLLMRMKQVRFALDRALLYIPVVGPLIVIVHMALFARTLAVLLKSGTKIVEALSITTDIIPNLAYHQVLSKATEQIKAGAPLGKYLANYPRTFPVMFSQMVEVSETAGTLDATLSYLSGYYEGELDDATHTLVALMEPLLMVTMGGIVGFIVLSILLPIYSISQAVT